MTPTPPGGGRPAAPTLAAVPWSSPIRQTTPDDGTAVTLASIVGVGTLSSVVLYLTSTGSSIYGAFTTGILLRQSSGSVHLIGNLLPPSIIPAGFNAEYFYPGPELQALNDATNPAAAPAASSTLSVSTYYLSGSVAADASGLTSVSVWITQTFPFNGQLDLLAITPAGEQSVVKGRMTGTRLIEVAL